MAGTGTLTLRPAERVRAAFPTRPQGKAGPGPVGATLGNRQLANLVGGMTVQRQGCGGACGCGGTCAGNTSTAPKADDLLDDAPLQRLETEAGVRHHVDPAPPLPAVRVDPRLRHTLEPLQGIAGNAALARLLGPAPASTTQVQRLAAADLLPGWITGAIFGTRDKAKAEAAKAEGETAKAEQVAEKKAEEAEAKVDAEAPKVIEKVEKTAVAAERRRAAGQAKVAQAKDIADKTAAKTAEQVIKEASLTKEGAQFSSLVQGKEPSCSLSKVAQAVENVADIVGKPFGVSGSALLAEVGKVAKGIGTVVKKGLEGVADLVNGATRAYGTAKDWVRRELDLDLTAVLKWAVALTNPITAMPALGRWAAGKIGKGMVWVAKKVGELARWASTEGPKLIASMKAKLGMWYAELPKLLRLTIEGIAAPFQPLVNTVKAAGRAIADKLKPRSDRAKTKADQTAVTAKAKVADIRAKSRDDKAKKQAEVAKTAEAKKAETKARAKAAMEEPKKEAGDKTAALAKEGQKEADKLSHKVCAELNEGGGPCVAEYLPDPAKGAGKGNPSGEGNTSAVSLTSAAEATVPIPETPFAVKVSKGSKVEVARLGDSKGSKTYTVSITGDGAVYANATLGTGGGSSPSLGVNVDLPGGGKAKVWEQITGKGGAKGAEGASGGLSAKGEIDSGYRCQSALVYTFTAGKTNCEGLGGLLGLLGVLGVKGTGFLGELAMLGADEAFENSLTSRKFTIASGVALSSEIKSQLGKIGAKFSTEAGVTLGQEKDKETGKMVDTVELFAGASGEIGAEMEVDILSGISAGANAGGQLSVVLGYVNDPATGTEDIDVIKLSAKASAAANVAGVELSKIDSICGPGVAGAIKKAVDIQVASHDPTMATAKGEVSLGVEPKKAKSSFGTVLSDPEVASKEGVLQKAEAALKQLKASGQASLTLTTTERLAGLGVDFSYVEPGVNIGGKASGSLDRSETRVLWKKEF